MRDQKLSIVRTKQKRRICIPIEFRAEGGGFYFLQLFERFLQESSWEITRDVSDRFDFLFTNHWMTPVKEIMRAIRANPTVRIVQRIDGVAQDYGREPGADFHQAEVNRLADLTIFQSQYARFAAREKFSVIRSDGPVIHNPVDVNIFAPREISIANGKPRVICVSWSTNSMKGAAQIFAVARANPDINFVLCGNFPEAPPLENVQTLGVLDRADLAAAYRSCEILLTFSKNEACPNHVLEALASGLPILYEDSGAMFELIKDCGLAVSVETFRQKYDEVYSKLRPLSTEARKRALQFFRPEAVLPRYIQAMEGILENPAGVFTSLRFALAWSRVFR
jgi:glycosyltransferase involved in cell wall biosynthesis